MAETIHVELAGRRLVWLKNDDGTGPLAYPEHVDEAGDVNPLHALYSESYAHVCDDGLIRRLQAVIGSVGDLVVLTK